MSHYICLGNCKAVSSSPSVCMASDCPKSGEALDACDCEDDKHEGRQDTSTDQMEEEVI